MVLHNIPAALFFFVPFYLYMRDSGMHPLLSIFWAFLKGKDMQSVVFLILVFSSLYDALEI